MDPVLSDTEVAFCIPASLVDRSPVTLEKLATAYGANVILGETLDRIFGDNCVAILRHAMISRNLMDGMCFTDIDEFVQEASVRMLQSFSEYDCKRSKVSTWINNRIGNYGIINKGRLLKKFHGKGVSYDLNPTAFDKEVSYDRTLSLRADFRSVINDMYELWPDNSDILLAIFGDHKDPEWQSPSKIIPKEVSKKTNCGERKISSFLKKKVYPMIRSRMGDSQ